MPSPAPGHAPDPARLRRVRDRHDGLLRGRLSHRSLVAGADARGAGGADGHARRLDPGPARIPARRDDGHGGGPVRRAARARPRRGERDRDDLPARRLPAGTRLEPGQGAAPRVRAAADRRHRRERPPGRHRAVERDPREALDRRPRACAQDGRLRRRRDLRRIGQRDDRPPREPGHGGHLLARPGDVLLLLVGVPR